MIQLKKIGILLLIIFLSNALAFTQSDDPIVFRVNDQPVHQSEFQYIYEKNNAQNADYSEKSIREYLDLYTKFKLKVAKAEQLGIGESGEFMRELAGYREQLAESYLSDKKMMDKLLKEAYEREKEEIDVSHILVKVPQQMISKDTTRYYDMAMKFKHMIAVEGNNFEEMVKKVSQDMSTRNSGGKLGYVHAVLPRGYYRVETAIYNTPVGEITEPVRSPRGYHILKVNDKRPARGEVEIAHILVRKGKNAEVQLAQDRRLQEVKKMLINGDDFAEVAKKYSDDGTTANKGGYIGFVSSGEYDDAFENEAFALTEDGQISNPVVSRVGTHIIKRISKKERKSFDEEKRRLETALKKTERIDLAKKSLIKSIKNEDGFKINKAGYAYFKNKIDSTFFSYRWNAPKKFEQAPLISFNNNISFGERQFVDYLRKNTRERVKYRRDGISKALDKMFDKFVDKCCLDYEKKNLENKYPDFKALMREYREGILLFEVTKKHVWDKAAQDSSGIQNYYAANKMNYKRAPRIEVKLFTVTGADEKTAKKMMKAAKKKSEAEIAAMYQSDKLKLVNSLLTISKESSDANQYSWKVGKVSNFTEMEKNGQTMYTFAKTVKNHPEGIKTLGEARGYVIADYQDHLEQKWVDELKNEFDVKIDEDVVKAMIK